MKKLLNILGSFALVSAAASSIVACKNTAKKDLKDLTDTLTISSLKTAADFKKELIKAIKAESDFENADDSEIEILKKDGSALADSDISATTTVKIKAKDKSEKISGEKEVKVTWTVKSSKKNLSSLKALTTTIRTADNDADAFITALVNELKKDSTFNTLDKDDIEVKKSDDSAVIDNAYIGTNTSIVVKIKPVSGSTKFEGSKDLTITRSSKQTLADLPAITKTIISADTNASAFITALVNEWKKDSTFNTLDKDDIEVKKSDDSAAIDNAYIGTNTSIVVKIKPLSGSTKFEGSKDLTITRSSKQTLADLPAITKTIISADTNASAFITALVNEWKKDSTFNTLDKDDIEVKKSDDSAAIDNAYIGTNTSIVVKIKPLSGSTKFEGSKDLTITRSSKQTLADLPAITKTIISATDTSAFITALVNEWKKDSTFNTLDKDDIEVKKSDDSAAIDNAYIGTNTSIVVKIKPVSGSTKFEGSKDLTITRSPI